MDVSAIEMNYYYYYYLYYTCRGGFYKAFKQQL